MLIRSLMFISLVAISLAGSAQVPKMKEAYISIQKVRRETQISIHLGIRNVTTSSLLVPTCGEMNGGRLLCDLGVHVEVRALNGWQQAKLKCDCALPGGLPLTQGKQVDAGKSENFTYQFDADYFSIAPGQRLRLVVDSWPDETAMANRDKNIQRLTSAEFVLP